MKKQFGFREGSRVSGDAAIVGKELERIRKKHGGLTAEVTVEEAKPKNAPLHDQFNWDDASAAHQHRLDQARRLIRAVVISVGDNKEPTSVYVHTADENSDGPVGKYERMDVVVESIDAYQSALQMLEQKLSSAARAVAELREVAGTSKHKGKLAIINIVMKALEAATAAVRKLAV